MYITIYIYICIYSCNDLICWKRTRLRRLPNSIHICNTIKFLWIISFVHFVFICFFCLFYFMYFFCCSGHWTTFMFCFGFKTFNITKGDFTANLFVLLRIKNLWCYYYIVYINVYIYIFHIISFIMQSFNLFKIIKI